MDKENGKYARIVLNFLLIGGILFICFIVYKFFILFFITQLNSDKGAQDWNMETAYLEVSVIPDTLDIWEFADVTIRAIDDKGKISSRYNNDVWVEVEWIKYNDLDFIIPWWWIALFEKEDKGIKIFSRGLSVEKPWNYHLIIEDVYDKNLVWRVAFTVIENDEVISNESVESFTSWDIKIKSVSWNRDVFMKTEYDIAKSNILIFLDDEEAEDLFIEFEKSLERTSNERKQILDDILRLTMKLKDMNHIDSIDVLFIHRNLCNIIKYYNLPSKTCA